MAKPRKPVEPPEDDATLFRRTVGAVKPVPSGRRPAPPRTPPQPIARSRLADERAALAESLAAPPADADIDSGEGHEYARPGIQHAVMRKLKRGQYRCDAELDLHGLTRDRAHAELVSFLFHSQASGARCVRIIHGKGHNSGNRGPVIKQSLKSWLRRDEVLAYASAPTNQGGSGATLVLLRAER